MPASTPPRHGVQPPFVSQSNVTAELLDALQRPLLTFKVAKTVPIPQVIPSIEEQGQHRTK